MNVRVGLSKKLSTEEVFLLNCGVGEDSWEPLDCKEIQPVHSKGNQSWILLEGLMLKLKLKLQYFGHLIQRADLFEKTLCWERLRAGGEGDDRGWDGWMASLTRWTRVWVSSESWWWTGKPGLLQFMASQTAGHNWVTELNWAHCLSHSQ